MPDPNLDALRRYAVARTLFKPTTLARAIQESVYGRFGIRLEPEPVVV